MIAQEGFEAWLDCSEVSEQEGKGVAIKSTTHFFTWMRENEVDDEEPWIVLKDLIVVISSYLIFSRALEASSNNGNTLAKSLSQESLNSLASFFYILVILSSS